MKKHTDAVTIKLLIELLDIAIEALEEHDDEGTVEYLIEKLDALKAR